MFPGDGGPVYLEILGTTQADAAAQQKAGRYAHQQMIEGLVREGKYVWQAFQAGNNVGSNNNNNSQGQGGTVHDAAYCTDWYAALQFCHSFVVMRLVRGLYV